MKLRLSLVVLAVTMGCFAVISTCLTLRAEPESGEKEPSLEAEIKLLQEIRAKEVEQIEKIKNLLAKEQEKINKEVSTTEKKIQELKSAYGEMTNKLSGMGISLEADKSGAQGMINGGGTSWPVQPYNGPPTPYGQPIYPVQNGQPIPPTQPSAMPPKAPVPPPSPDAGIPKPNP
jgi:hypothetical protein